MQAEHTFENCNSGFGGCMDENTLMYTPNGEPQECSRQMVGIHLMTRVLGPCILVIFWGLMLVSL